MKKNISDTPEFLLTGFDFVAVQDSAFLVRERSRGSKLEAACKKNAVLLEQPNHIITFLHVRSNQPTIISKSDIGHTDKRANEPCCPPEAAKKLMANNNQPAMRDVLPITSKLSTNQELQSETRDSITKVPYFPPFTQPVIAETSQKQMKRTPALIELKQKHAKDSR